MFHTPTSAEARGPGPWDLVWDLDDQWFYIGPHADDIVHFWDTTSHFAHHWTRMPRGTMGAGSSATPAAPGTAMPLATTPAAMAAAPPAAMLVPMAIPPPLPRMPGPPSAAAAGGYVVPLADDMPGPTAPPGQEHNRHLQLHSHRPLGRPDTWPAQYWTMFIGNMPSWVQSEDVVAICEIANVQVGRVKIFPPALETGQCCATVLVRPPLANMQVLIQELHGHL